MATKRKPAPVQGLLFRRGGKRDGAGRKRKSERELVPHRVRDRVTRHQPVLVTTRLRAGLPNLRQERTLARLREVLAAGADRHGFRLVEYSLQSNHIHFLAEAPDQRVLARGVQGLLVRIARALNRIWGRTGRIVSDRYHVRVLKSPRAVRNALVYVLQNAKKHGARITGIDACSSGPWFRGWLDRAPRQESPLLRAESWLLTTGWIGRGLIATFEAPASRGSP
jgi:putative transposase